MIARLGKEINNPESVYYWAQKVRDWGGGKDARFSACVVSLSQPPG